MLLAIAALVASQLPPAFWLVMACYLALNLSYTFYLKRKLLVDVIALSGAYTLRILAGNAAGPVELSNWLLAFSMFLFLSLALVKRYIELDTVGVDPLDEKRVMGRGYRRSDLDMISQLGVASGFAAVVVLALFVEGAGKSGLYTHREMIWLVCPIILYVISRIWVLAKRRELPDDPIMFILRDWRSHLMGAIVVAIFFLAV
jgi:4-hydroxybenzoate polyprenyltransferase